MNQRMQLRMSLSIVLRGAAIAALLVLVGAAPSADPVARLQRRIDCGEVKLTRDDDWGYLKSVLRELRVPADSQALVFSKTSFQSQRISPQTPRAIYFNDDLYIGWVQGGDVIEVASVSPQDGPVFYLLSQERAARPRFVRDTGACAQCHQAAETQTGMSLLMRSVYPDSSGFPAYGAGTFDTTDQSPPAQRWGGWYVDGRSERATMGNGTASDPAHPDQLEGTGHADLAKRFDVAPYLTPHSDVVALAVLAHQVHLHNQLTNAAIDVRAALRDEATLKAAIGDRTPGHSASTLGRIAGACEPVVEAMLFCNAADLGPIQGSSRFALEFEALGPRDRQGRSLRDFDLRRRLFRYPCSYLIYSEQFDALPDPGKQYVYRRLWKVLTGRDDSPKFDHLSDADRDAIDDILCDTKKDLPAYFKPRR